MAFFPRCLYFAPTCTQPATHVTVENNPLMHLNDLSIMKYYFTQLSQTETNEKKLSSNLHSKIIKKMKQKIKKKKKKATIKRIWLIIL